jgi:hypothetical protein
MSSGLIVTMGEHKGKIRFNDKWASLWKLFGGAFLEVVFLSIFFAYLYPFAEAFFKNTLPLSIGITSAVIGLFFIWFLHAFDFDLTKRFRWVFPLVCFLITIANIRFLFYLPTA